MRPALEKPGYAPEPSGPNNVPDTTDPTPHVPPPSRKRSRYLQSHQSQQRQITDVPPLSNPHDTSAVMRPPGHPQRATSHDGPRTQDATDPQKGGDPAAPSGTATLLRLSPNRQSHLRRLPLLRVGPPASGVTDFRDLTGGVYKARERIHRSVADLRLLATPTSWGRVADPNPN